MYQPPDPSANQQTEMSNQTPYYPQQPPSSPVYPPVTGQPSYVPPPPPPGGYYPPTPPPPYPSTGYGQPPYTGTPPSSPNYTQPDQQWPNYVPPTQSGGPRKPNSKTLIIAAAILVCVIVIGIFGAVLASQHPTTTNTNSTPTTGAATTPGTTPTINNTTPTTVSSTPPTTTSSGTGQIGQPIAVGGYTVTVNSAKTSTGDDIYHPKSGNTYLVIDVSVKNTSTASQDISSLLNFELQDSTGQKYQETFTDIGTPPDQTSLQPGGIIRGQLVYEVPQSMHQYTFTFLADPFNNGATATWNINI